EGADHFTPAGNAGVKARLTEELEVGASVQIGFTTSNDSHLSAPGLTTFNANYTNPMQQLHLSPNQPSCTVDISLPTVGRAGVRMIRPRWDLELDAVYEGWHVNQGWVIKFAPSSLLIRGPGTVGNQLPDITIPKDFGDSVSVRLGGDWSAWGDPRPG